MMGRVDTRRFRDELWAEQRGLCAWPPCRKPLKLQGAKFVERPEVDHNHRCCDVQARTCGKCVRGLVHKLCNVKDIHWMDVAIDRGFDPPPGAIRDYLMIGDINCRGEQYLLPGEYESVGRSAEDEFLYELDYETQERELREQYPYFTAQVFDGLTITELRYLNPNKVTRRQVTYRLSQEKARFSKATVQRRLQEEKEQFLFAVGR